MCYLVYPRTHHDQTEHHRCLFSLRIFSENFRSGPRGLRDKHKTHLVPCSQWRGEVKPIFHQCNMKLPREHRSWKLVRRWLPLLLELSFLAKYFWQILFFHTIFQTCNLQHRSIGCWKQESWHILNSGSIASSQKLSQLKWKLIQRFREAWKDKLKSRLKLWNFDLLITFQALRCFWFKTFQLILLWLEFQNPILSFSCFERVSVLEMIS